jgi:hypothetical protein
VKVSGVKMSGLDVAAADVQGLADNIRYWGTRKLEWQINRNHLPAIFNGAGRLDFMQALVMCINQT